MQLLLALLQTAGAAFPLDYEAFTGGRVNPLGLQQQLTIGPRLTLVDAPDDDLLFGESYLWFGPLVKLSPAFAGVGLTLRVMPFRIGFIELNGERLVSWSDGEGIRSGDAMIPYTEATVQMARTAGNVLGNGWRASGVLRLQAAVGPVALRSTTTAQYLDLALPDDAIVYDMANDVLALSRGWELYEDVDLLYVFEERRPFVGLRYSVVQSFGELRGWPGPAVQRLGPAVGWTFPSEAQGFQYPTLLLLTQWHLSHPWRTGQATSAALPYIGVGFTFAGRVGDLP